MNDPQSGTDFSHRAESDGITVNGEYRVLLPDGRRQIVDYVADDSGYNADVKYEGEANGGNGYGGGNGNGGYPSGNGGYANGGNGGYSNGGGNGGYSNGGNGGYSNGGGGRNGNGGRNGGGGGYPSGNGVSNSYLPPGK